MDELLNDLYYTKHNYDGINNLYKKAKLINNKISKNDVKLWLQKQSTYQQNFSKVEKKKFLPIYSELENAYQIDLTFLPQYKKQNNNNYVLFTAIGVNNRWAYASYSKDKKTDTILNLFKEFHKSVPVFKIYGDLGSEFINLKFKKYLNDNNIESILFKSDSHRLGIINRFHRTLKSKISSFMIATNSVKWTQVLETIIDNYNNTFNRGIQMKPIDAFNSWFHESLIIQDKRRETRNIMKNITEFNLSDRVRKLNVSSNQFENKMRPKYSNEIYTITKINKNTLQITRNNISILAKKSDVIKVNEETIETEPVIKNAVRENKIVRLINKEDLIQDQTKNRTRANPKKKVLD